MLVVLHRWLGATIALMVTVWCLSGIVMMYRGYPSVTLADRLRRAPTIDPAEIKISVEQAFSARGHALPSRVLLTSFDGRPIYVGDGSPVYADDGSEQQHVTRAMVDRAASAWSGQPLSQATIASVDTPDAWTLTGSLRLLLPLLKYSWPDGQQVYVHPATADVVQHTTRESRFWAYLGAIPHWLYIPAIRTMGAHWFTFMVWTSLVSTIAITIGIVIAIRRYSFRKRYRYQGAPASIPYHGWKRWHTIAGLFVGGVAVTWSFSGMMSLEPFGLDERLSALTVARDPEKDAATTKILVQLSDLLLQGRVDIHAFAAKPLPTAISSVSAFGVKEVEFVSYAGRPFYVATNGEGNSLIVPVDGPPRDSFDHEELVRRLRVATGDRADVELLSTFDAYYRDRTGVFPLPIIRVRMKDGVGSRYYISPQTATIVTSYSAHEWVGRWLFEGLHSLDFPWLYNRRPLWDIVVVGLLAGCIALCLTSLVLTYRVIVRTAARAGEFLVSADSAVSSASDTTRTAG